MKLVFHLRGESFQHLERSTYLDEDRCLLHLQDFLLQIENQDPKVTVSFVVPDSWEVISTTRPARDGSYLIEGKRPAPFYLGRAEGVQDEDGNLVSIAIEPGWPPANELQTALLRQIRYRQKFGKKPGSKAAACRFSLTETPGSWQGIGHFGRAAIVGFHAQCPRCPRRHCQCARSSRQWREDWPVCTFHPSRVSPRHSARIDSSTTWLSERFSKLASCAEASSWTHSRPTCGARLEK